MFNNSSIIARLAELPDKSSVPPSSTRKICGPEPILAKSLRSQASIDFEANALAPNALQQQQIQDATREAIADETLKAELQEEISLKESLTRAIHTPEEPRNPFAKIAQWAAARKAVQKMRIPAKWESHHVLSAIDRKDVEILMYIRDSAFELLLQDTGMHETPLKYAMRVQPDMAIILLGAFSRYINNLQDEDLGKESTRKTLLSLRADLHSAIRHGLATSQKDLVASFLQTLVMSEGDKWIVDNVAIVRKAIAAGPPGKPVRTAQNLVRKFAASALKNANSIAAVEDYIANAASDLLLMAAWAAAAKPLNASHISVWLYKDFLRSLSHKVDQVSSFARDDRVYRSFVECLNSHMGAIEQEVPFKLRKQLEVLREGMQGRRLSYKQKLEALARQLDAIQSAPTQPTL
ncbi:hypothetical protein EIP91_011050 [Steccherinum ochraceum]|uniref:Uncharacterized protein n=1 Tax=Steccherinum ochraceum TaxID=92696 RepID=A0A4R0RYG0_9APHY|nr:hypothetical protein EIP91_011050 [Steccherinum ochraceum]